MSDTRLRRITKEINDCKTDNTSAIDVVMVDDSPFHLVGTFPGPENSPYDGGIFDVDIRVPEGYPFQPPKMKFITKVYHPNISSASGAICLDILKDQWSPVLTLKSTLMSLRSLLCSPEPTDPQDAEVAKHYLADRADFEKTAAYWTQIYANGSESAKPPSSAQRSDSTTSSKAAAARQGAGTGTGVGATNKPEKDEKEEEQDPALVAGLKTEHVEQFVNMGFERRRVIEVLKRLNYRGANIRNVPDETVLNDLLS